MTDPYISHPSLFHWHSSSQKVPLLVSIASFSVWSTECNWISLPKHGWEVCEYSKDSSSVAISFKGVAPFLQSAYLVNSPRGDVTSLLGTT